MALNAGYLDPEEDITTFRNALGLADAVLTSFLALAELVRPSRIFLGPEARRRAVTPEDRAGRAAAA